MCYNFRPRMMKKLRFFCTAILLALSSIGLQGCLPSPYYQKVYSLPKNEWKYDHQLSFKFKIEDTAALHHLYFIIRHTDAYPFSNIWLWVHLKPPGAADFEKLRIEIPLAETSGKWLGRGMGEIWEQRMPLTTDEKSLLFTKPGLYEIRLEQNMRVNPLPEILQIGLRVANAGHKKAPPTPH